jgi:hypothetical protein
MKVDLLTYASLLLFAINLPYHEKTRKQMKLRSIVVKRLAKAALPIW